MTKGYLRSVEIGRVGVKRAVSTPFSVNVMLVRPASLKMEWSLRLMILMPRSFESCWSNSGGGGGAKSGVDVYPSQDRWE